MADFRSKVPTIAIWDDNDYGGSDIGKTFAHKRRSRDLFLDFWCSEAEAEARRRPSGIYGLWEFGAPDRRVQIIVPDLRYCRSEWAQTEAAVRQELGDSGFGPYKPLVADDVSMLGERQWAWLEDCLRRPAELRLFVSSIQLVPEGRGWESWSNFPSEKQRLLDTIQSTGAKGVFVLSGDSHYGEVSYDDKTGIGYPLWDVTSSGMTEEWTVPGPNPSRIGSAYPQTNFGLVTVNWLTADPMIVVELYDETGGRLRQLSVLLSSLRRHA
jgi:alkaline phosphatase D